MARRFRKTRSRRRYRRRRFRRRTVGGKALRRVRSLSRKIDGEVKKLDHCQLVTETMFTGLSRAIGTAADNPSSLPDFGYLYNVFNGPGIDSAAQGTRLADLIGERCRAKYIYFGIHLQMPQRPNIINYTAGGEGSYDPTATQQPVCLRCMIVQDRNYMASALTITDMVENLFGVTSTTGDNSYKNNCDFTLLPINPQEPGRFRVIRDFKMYVAPGWRQDYYKKIVLLQRDLLSGGRFYTGTTANLAQGNAPGELASAWAAIRNGLYLLFFYQNPTLYSVVNGNATGRPDFNISVQTRFAFYDN